LGVGGKGQLRTRVGACNLTKGKRKEGNGLTDRNELKTGIKKKTEDI